MGIFGQNVGSQYRKVPVFKGFVALLAAWLPARALTITAAIPPIYRRSPADHEKLSQKDSSASLT